MMDPTGLSLLLYYLPLLMDCSFFFSHFVFFPLATSAITETRFRKRARVISVVIEADLNHPTTQAVVKSRCGAFLKSQPLPALIVLK